MALTSPAARDTAAGALTAAVVVLLGAPLGLLWAALAPQVRADGRGVDLEVLFIGSREGAFVLLSLAVGGLAGALGWVLGRRRGPGVLLGLVVGGLLAAATAAHTGTVWSRARFEAASGEVVPAPVALEPPVAVVVLPLAAAVVFGALVLLLERPRRGISSG